MFAASVIGGAVAACAAPEGANYDESKVPQYTLPDPLRTTQGEPVADAAAWRGGRRAEILSLFETHVYGRVPGRIEGTSYEVVSVDAEALEGKATRKVVRARFGRGENSPSMDAVVYVPNAAPKPVPLFLGILLFDSRAQRPLPGKPLLDELKTPPAGTTPDRFPGARTIDVVLDRGYAIATIDPDELSPDDPEKYLDGVLPSFWPEGRTARGPEDCGSIGAWAWGLSRALDYFRSEEQTDVDGDKVIAVGHSRRGKTALWAGAQDERFAMAISNQSGCGGAALSRRAFGETVKLINERFPHWFCERFRDYNDNEPALPVDQHELIALIAPRPVYVGSAVEDRWADPRGEFLACVGADPVYRLLGAPGLRAGDPPPLNVSVGETIGYHVRSGSHALSDFDWMMYLDFADRHFRP
jgi:hypothetical protein